MEEGWFDYFWKPKGIEPRDGKEINSAVLVMTDAGVDKRTMWNDEPRRVGFTISNYGEAALRNASLSWMLTGTGGVVSQGSLSQTSMLSWGKWQRPAQSRASGGSFNGTETRTGSRIESRRSDLSESVEFLVISTRRRAQIDPDECGVGCSLERIAEGVSVHSRTN